MRCVDREKVMGGADDKEKELNANAISSARVGLLCVRVRRTSSKCGRRWCSFVAAVMAFVLDKETEWYEERRGTQIRSSAAWR